MLKTSLRYVTDETGATAIEYSLIAAFIALAIFGSVQLVGPAVEAALHGAAAGFD